MGFSSVCVIQKRKGYTGFPVVCEIQNSYMRFCEIQKQEVMCFSGFM